MIFSSICSAQNLNTFDSIKASQLKQRILVHNANDSIAVEASFELVNLYYQINLDSAIFYSKKALLISKKERNDSKIIEAYKWLSYLYSVQGKESKALEFILLELEKQKETKDTVAILSALNALGSFYVTQEEYELALKSFDEAIVLSKTNRVVNKEIIFNLYNNRAVVKTTLQDTEGALSDFLTALKFFKKQEGKGNASSVYLNLYATYSTLKNNKKANEYLDKTLKSLDSTSENYSKVLCSLAQKVEDNNLTRAIELTQKAYKSAEQKNRLEDIKTASLYLYKFYKKSKETEASLRFYEISVKAKDSLVSLKNEKRIIKQIEKNRYEKQKLLSDAENKLVLTKEKEAKERQKIISYSVGIGLVLVVIFLLFIYQKLQVTKKQNAIIALQKQEVEKQKETIEETHKEIRDSINYAERLQSAILPPQKAIKDSFSNSFVLFNPKDVVSGDFYWFEKRKGIKYLAVADCTGHGVPGALVSVVCSGALNQSVKEFLLKEPSEILNKTREIIVGTFAKSDEDIKDGMDIALCKFENDKLIFSGANNPLWIVRQLKELTEVQQNDRRTVVLNDLALIEIPANRQPVGLSLEMKLFEQKKIDLIKGDKIYLFTDGYADQFGGAKGKKLKSKALKEILISISNQSMSEQEVYLSKFFKNWIGGEEQIDDVCMIGVEV